MRLREEVTERLLVGPTLPSRKPSPPRPGLCVKLAINVRLPAPAETPLARIPVNSLSTITGLPPLTCTPLSRPENRFPLIDGVEPVAAVTTPMSLPLAPGSSKTLSAMVAIGPAPAVMPDPPLVSNLNPLIVPAVPPMPTKKAELAPALMIGRPSPLSTPSTNSSATTETSLNRETLSAS